MVHVFGREMNFQLACYISNRLINCKKYGTINSMKKEIIPKVITSANGNIIAFEKKDDPIITL